MTKRQYLELGATPYDEDCVQVGEENYQKRAFEECGNFIKLLREKFGNEPNGAELKIKGFPHDFGRYYEVVCYFEEDNEKAVDYAFNIENNVPATWDSVKETAV